MWMNWGPSRDASSEVVSEMRRNREEMKRIAQDPGADHGYGEKKQLGCILQLLTGVVYNSRAVIVNKIHSSHTVLYNYFALFSKHRTVSDNQVAVLVWPG